MIFKSGRFAQHFLSRPNSTSVWIVRSCASSSMIKQYWLSRSSSSASRSNMPSVMYLITVSGLVQSSNRMAYPTSSPRRHPNSSATRLATDIAATRRGCVHPILPRLVYPASARYCVICVVFPEPVSPITTKTWLSFTALMSSSRSLKMGSDSRCCCMGSELFWPNVGALPNASIFHAGISLSLTRPVPRSSCAKTRSPSAAMGSSHGRFRSCGTASSSARCCVCCSSRLSFANACCVIAARCMDPSGFLTILMGETSPWFVWPSRKGASLSLISISTSCSASSSNPSTPSFSASNVGYSSTRSAPDAMSCFASKRSGELILFTALRRPPKSPARSSSVSWMPERPRREPPGGGGAFADQPLPAPPPIDPTLRDPAVRGPTRSCPVLWSTSRMLSAILAPERVVTLTHTGWPARTCSRALTPFLALIRLACTSPSRFPRNSVSSTNAPKSITLLTRPR